MTKPAVLLISPGIIKWTDMDFGLPHLVSMGGYLQAHLDVRVEILDLNYEGGDHRQLERTIESLGPFVCIGLSCFSSFDYLRVLTLGRFLRDLYPDVPLITGGYHASALPGDLVFEGSPFDAVVVGEGELPMTDIVRTLLGGGRLEKKIYGPANIQTLDDLPPYRWDLLNRYWGRAHDIGRKFQIYLSRGCPYHCTFCMERAKTEYKWRAYSSERAVDELRRLASVTSLKKWVINLADPLFGFRRRWRREVLEGILEHQLLPRQYWTLTRSDDLDVEDVKLLAKAQFSIGIGLESGSPAMLTRMQKGNTPEKYLAAMMRLARLSRDHGLNWASNIIVGHPGETMESMRETRDYLYELFTSAKETCGWLSIDPFRLYPGAFVHETMSNYTKQYGTKFYHPEWWKSWYDGPFRAEHIDPSTEVDFETRVRFMYDAYPPLVREIATRFRGQGRSIDRVFSRSLSEQERQLSPAMRDQIIRYGRRARKALSSEPTGGNGANGSSMALKMPIGLHIKDPWIRSREEAVRRLLQRGILRTERLTEAFLQVPTEQYVGEEAARSVFRNQSVAVEREGDASPALGINLIAMALEALEPAIGESVADLTAASGYVAALLAELVTPSGSVLAMHAGTWRHSRALKKVLGDYPQVTVTRGDPTAGPPSGTSPLARVYIGGALPRLPAAILRALEDPEGRAVTFLGPRFRPQDLVALVRRGEELDERAIARVKVPVLSGRAGWLRAPMAAA